MSELSKKRALFETETGAHVTSQLMSNLVESAKNLPSNSSELGSIQLNLHEVKKRAADLRKKKQATTNHTGAYYLLAGDGLVLEDMKSVVSTLEKKGVSSRNVNFENNGELNGSTGPNKDEDILSAIEKQLVYAANDFDNQLNKSLNLDWDEKRPTIESNFKKQLLRRKSINHQHMKQAVGFQDTNETKYADHVQKFNINSNYDNRLKFEEYAKTIHKFNNERLDGLPDVHRVLSKFFELSQYEGQQDSSTSQFADAWAFLSFNSEYDNNYAYHGLKFLESEFMNFVNELVDKNSAQPTDNTFLSRIKLFVNKKLKTVNGKWKVDNLFTVDDEPIWMISFYLLRAGKVDECVEYLSSFRNNLKKIEQPIITYLKAYQSSGNGQLTGEFGLKINSEYNQHIKTSIDGDPFRMAVYKIIGKCDVSRKNFTNVTFSIEDWIWLHLSLITDQNNTGDKALEYPLAEFQSLIISYGAKRFSNSYLKVLILVGLYEYAVDYAFTISPIDTVHLAICLCIMKLLKTTSTGPAVLSSTKSGYLISSENGVSFNFSNLLVDYVEAFKLSDPKIAAEYLTLLVLDEHIDKEYCKSCLESLTLDTREFTFLLGKINADGTKIIGTIERLYPLVDSSSKEEFLTHIAEVAVKQSTEDGRDYDSVLLYQILEKPDYLFAILNKQICELISTTPYNQNIFVLEDKSEVNPVLVAERLLPRYISCSQSQVEQEVGVCRKLLDILQIKSLFMSGAWDLTLDKIFTLNILPHSDENTARDVASEYPLLNENISRCIPNLLLFAMVSIANLATQYDEGSEKYSELFSIAKCLMVYSGLIQFRMQRDTYALLNKFDISK
ncbi:Nucleoporin NIC96 [Nakaseomyces bracarensis]|uniref:Nucleoporin NIC96 n=1 Tax=Nakaseomyces bracarensis TaxID=273131 RepID=UPI003871B4CB